MEVASPEEDFVALLERHQAILHRVTTLYASNAEDRRDLFQEMVFQLWRAWPAFRREASVTTWMYRIALNTALTRIRRARTAPALLPLEEEPAAGRNVAHGHEPQDRLRSLHDAIRSLEPGDRALVMLHLEELSHRQIAEILGINENLVGVKLHRIRGRLRAKMKSSGNG